MLIFQPFATILEIFGKVYCNALPIVYNRGRGEQLRLAGRTGKVIKMTTMTTIVGTQEECIRQAVASGGERLADLQTISYVFCGDTLVRLSRVEPEPDMSSPDWVVWANKTGQDAEWQFIPVSGAEACEILTRSMEREIDEAKTRREIRLNSIRFRAENPVIPWSEGGLAALIAADSQRG